MSSDYITRLRGELLRAGAPQPARRRARRALRRLRPLAVAAAIVAVVAVVALAVPHGGDREIAADAVTLEYRVEPASAAGATAQRLRERLGTLRVMGARVSATATGVAISAPASARADVAALTQPGKLAIYDWELSVLGPRGRPGFDDDSVTGGENAGQAAALSEREAKARGHAVQAANGGWFALGDRAGLTNAGVAGAEAATDAMTHDPVVRVHLTLRGQLAFRDLTRGVVLRGARLTGNQHIAITVDDRLLSVPYIDWRSAPDGLDEFQIAGGLTPRSARQLAVILSSGPLPAVVSPA